MTSHHLQPSRAVFVVDDEAAILDAVKGLLALRDIRVQTYCSAKTFLESYRDEWTGCLIVDHCMPGMGGIELLKELRERGSTMPSILMTGNGNAQALRQAMDFGAVEYLEKPFHFEQMIATMKRRCPDLFHNGNSAAARLGHGFRD